MRFDLLDGFEIIVAADGEPGRTGLGWRPGKAGGAKSLRDAIAGRHRALDRIPNRTYHEHVIRTPRRNAGSGVQGGVRSGAAGAGRTWPRPRCRRWSAGRRRTPTSLGCARPRKARGGPSQGSPGCLASTRRLPALHFPRPRGRRKMGKGDARRPKSKRPGGVALSSWAV